MFVAKVLAAGLAMSALAASQASALTITNRDTGSHTVLIQKGDYENEVALPSGTSVDEDCDEGCILRLAGVDGELAAQSEDRVVIHGGQLQREQQ